MEKEELKYNNDNDSLKGPYNKDDFYCKNLNLEEYIKYCKNLDLNPEARKLLIKNNIIEKGKNTFENQNITDINEKTTAEGTNGNINQKNDFNRRDNEIPENFNYIPTNHQNQQAPNFGNNFIRNIELNNVNPQFINETSSLKPKKLIFKIINIPKKKETVERNEEIKNEIKKEEIPSQLPKSLELFKTEKIDNFFDDYQFLTFKLKLDTLIFNENNKKIGRLPTYLKTSGIKGKHNRKSKDNLYIKIIHYCQFSIDKCIKNEIREYKLILKDLTIKQQLKTGGFENINNFCLKNLYDIYIHSFPKNIKNSEKLRKINKITEENKINEETKATILSGINIENKNKKAKIKILNLYLIKLFFLLF